ncbi:hypothetical protein GWK47_034566 [Chionoecetes opilio]|uniref:Cc8K15.2-like protein n=1 Tax=Chionoecetes opilio TaxID=41210 RepID=A0A8J4YUS8_CHIOP|nr:hypothetical protein GWK47_034566 [Chionoecetes opilio]
MKSPEPATIEGAGPPPLLPPHREMGKTRAREQEGGGEEVLPFWSRARIPTTTVIHAGTKLSKLVKAYNDLKKNKNKDRPKHRMDEEIFKGDVQEIFDLAHSSSLQRADVTDEDKEFLRSQREDRGESSMAGIDLVTAKKVEKQVERGTRLKRLREREDSDIARLTARAEIPSKSSSSSSSPVSTTSSPARGSRSQRKKLKQSPSISVKDLNLISTWDREKLSVRQATSTFAATPQVLGMDIGSMAVSKSTVHRARIAGREQAAEKIVELRNQEIPERLVLHWDGKLLPSLSGDTEDRIAVLLTGEDDAEFLLGVPASSDSTGRNVAAVVLKEVDEAGIRDKIIAFCFDTTASNTGMVQGACILIEQELGRSLLWLACRHHVLEVILKDVFEASLGSSSGPDIGIFKRLHDRWSFVDSSQRETVETSEDLVEFFATNDTASKLKDDALAFLKEALMSKNHPREDYEELLRLSYLFLGGEGPAKPFRRPGALHQARWMAKAIYCLKLQMLKSQLSLTGRDKAGVERVALFVALVHCKQWHEAPISVKAPLNDVLFLEILRTYPDQTVAKAAEQALRCHLWYVSEENAGLAFFDSRIDVEKKQMVKALDKPSSKKELKRLEGKMMTMSSSLSSFVTSKTRSFFQKLDADEGFLAKDPALWEEDDRFKDARKRALGLRVVNDAAERGIALVQRYLGSTKSAAEKKYLLQLVHHHRKLVGREKKENLQKKAF